MFLCLACFGTEVLAQKQFSVKVEIAPALDPKKVEVWADNGKAYRRVDSVRIQGRWLQFSGTYIGTYAAIVLQYQNDGISTMYANSFFVQEKPAKIRIRKPVDPERPFGTYHLTNALDFRKEKEDIQRYANQEQQEALAYQMAHKKSLFSGDTSILNPFLKLMTAYRLKQLEYVKEHTDSYYSFFLFRSDIVYTRDMNFDTLLQAFLRFPYSFRFTDEGNYVRKFLNANWNRTGTAVARFEAKDVNGKTVSMDEWVGKKIVLIHFWATWCAPCVSELPSLKKLKDAWASKGLEVVSMAYPSSKYADYLSALDKHGMDWTNIYYNEELFNMYANPGIPRLLLIDLNGKIVLDSEQVDREKLFQALEEKLPKISIM